MPSQQAHQQLRLVQLLNSKQAASGRYGIALLGPPTRTPPASAELTSGRAGSRPRSRTDLLDAPNFDLLVGDARDRIAENANPALNVQRRAGAKLTVQEALADMRGALAELASDRHDLVLPTRAVVGLS